MRTWHVCCGLGIVVTVTCLVPVREHHVPVKGDFLRMARKGDFLGVTVIGRATVGAAAVGLPIGFDERWDEVSDIAVPKIAVPDIAVPKKAVPDIAVPDIAPTPPAPTTAQAAPVPRQHYARELCAAHGMRREHYHRGRWLYWRCKK